MEGEVQPKFGLMVPLILMNITAIALFFFASPTPRGIPKKRESRAEKLPGPTEMVMAGDADNKIAVETGISIPGDVIKVGEVEEGVLSMKKIGQADIENPRYSVVEKQSASTRYSLTETQRMLDKVEMRVLSSQKKANQSDRQTEPPLAIALKKFIGSSTSGMRIFFEGLKNGYTKKRVESIASSNTSLGRRVVTPVWGEDIDHKQSISPSVEKIPTSLSPAPLPTQELPESTPNWVFGSWEDGSTSNNEIIPTEIVMDVLSRTQNRTNELINIFSKKVVPAIERMNDKVTEAIRLEKNLDTYTSALINAVNSVVCPNTDTEIDLTTNNTKRESVVRKMRHSKAFCSNLSFIRDSRIRDYVGGRSKGEHHSINNRPVFKTLSARCWHARNWRGKTNKKRSIKSAVPGGSTELQPSKAHESVESNHGHAGTGLEISHVVLEQSGGSESKHNQVKGIESRFENLKSVPIVLHKVPRNEGISNEGMKIREISHQRTIGIEEVLALTSSFEQSSDQVVSSDKDVKPLSSDLDSSISLSSGTVCRSYSIEPPELTKTELCQKSRESAPWALEQPCSPENIAPQSSELSEGTTWQGKKAKNESSSDLSVLCDSRIQGYDSSLGQKKISTAAVNSHENEHIQTVGSSQDSKWSSHRGESNCSTSFSGKTMNTMDLVNTFQQLNLQQKEFAMENVCLLVLRIFEAWTESQRSLSSLRLSRLSLTSCPSTDEGSSQSSRPRTAIRKSKMYSDGEQKFTLDRSVSKNGVPNDEDPLGLAPNFVALESSLSTQISENMVLNIVEAAEIQIAEKSLSGLRTNILRNPSSKSDRPKELINPAGVPSQSGFGDIEEKIIADEELAALLKSKSNDSIKVSKESSAATFYTGQPESSEDAFYECVSTMSAATCGSLELEVEDSSTVFLERIQEEEIRVLKNDVKTEAKTEEKSRAGPQATNSSFSVESWLTDSGDDLLTAMNTLHSGLTSDNSSVDIGCGTDDETYPPSLELSAAESKDEKSRNDMPKKKKWTSKLLKKILKKKPKPASNPNVALSKNTSRSQSDAVLKTSEHDPVKKDCETKQ